jgi:3-dehydroquinate synthase
VSAEIVRVELGARSYDVVIGPGLLAEAGPRIAAIFPGRNVVVVTDENVGARYLQRLRPSFAEAGIEVAEVVVPPGEGSKSFERLQAVVEAILESRRERNDVVVALGGGVIGDLAGFAAAITRRGMHLVQMPTTLLAQVDSSVGGKTGINAPQGKNLVGAFMQPTLVLADTDTLDTLPRREFRAGYAEMAKVGLIADAAFFDWLEKNYEGLFSGGPALISGIARSVAFKAKTVAADEHETGERALLNLGHPFGHAIEAACGFDPERLVHGEAVAIGMVMAHDFSVSEGLAPPADADRVRAHLKAAGLPVSLGSVPGAKLAVEELMRHIAQDKKVKRGKLTFILTRGIGKAFIANDVPPDKIHAFLKKQALR